MAYLTGNILNLKMYTATAFGKRARQPTLDKYSRKSKHLEGNVNL
jgi:hypothetical protein